MPFTETRLKGISLVVKWVGALLVLLSILGVFKHSQRIALYNTLRNENQVTIMSPVAKDFMRRFGLSEQEISSIKRLFLNYIFFGAGQGGIPMTGTIMAEREDKKGRAVSSWMEIHSWANESSQTYSWVGFSLVFVGSVLDTVMYFYTRKKVKNENADISS